MKECDSSKIHVTIHLFIPQSALRQAHRPFQSDFPTECGLVLRPSIFNIISFAWYHPVPGYIFFLVLPSLLSFRLSFLQSRGFGGTSYSRCDQSSSSSFILLYLYTL